jgi:lysophospholipase L1-like esterase
MRHLTALLVFAFAATALAQPAGDADRAAKWEKEVATIEKRQAEQSPEKGGIVFGGSSTVRLWDLAKSFPDWKATNSGFGGSEIRDVTHFADRLVFKHDPRAIVLYAGDNDVNSGRTPELVLADFRAFVEMARKKVPKARTYFIAIKPSPARWAKFETQSRANALVNEFCARDDRLAYIDVVPLLFGKDGRPREELYVKDQLHLSPAGYEVLSEAVRKAVK